MLEDLDAMHSTLLDAYKAALALREIDLDATTDVPLPTRHVPV